MEGNPRSIVAGRGGMAAEGGQEARERVWAHPQDTLAEPWPNCIPATAHPANVSLQETSKAGFFLNTLPSLRVIFSAQLFVYFWKAKYIHSEVLKQRKLPSSQCWLLPAITPEEKFHKLLTPILLPISQQSCFLVFFHAFPNNLNFFCCIVKQSMNLRKTESQQQAESLCIKKGHFYFTFK